jgi:signal transduction histidine kinase
VPNQEQNQDRIVELSELAGGLAHEIRNPLSTLKVNLQLLSEDFGEGPDGADIDPDLRRRALQRLATLRSETDRLQHLLDDFLKLVGGHDITSKPQDVNEVVGHLVEFFTPRAEGLGIQMRMSLSDEPLVCQVDEALLKQALLNLCLNAQQAMPDGGELMVQTSSDGAWAHIEITDTGVGIDPEVKTQLFKPFFSTKKGGSGLGLSLTRRIIAEHGGTISVQSEPGKGSRFTVRLPRSGAR